MSTEIKAGKGSTHAHQHPPAPEAYETTLKPALRGVSHQHAIFAALAAGILLVCSASGSEAKLCCALYVACMLALFTASTLYHRPTWTPEARQHMRKLDHGSIYLLIAGTYTPIAYLGVGGATGTHLLWLVWGGAAAGILQLFLLPKAPRLLATLIYIALGWVIIPHAGEVADALGPAGPGLLVAGGLAYSIGGLIYVVRWPDPAPKVFGYHEIFHMLVIVASALHFAAIYMLVEDKQIQAMPCSGD